MKLTYIAPTVELILAQKNDILTASNVWTPGENETERAYSVWVDESYSDFTFIY